MTDQTTTCSTLGAAILNLWDAGCSVALYDWAKTRTAGPRIPGLEHGDHRFAITASRYNHNQKQQDVFTGYGATAEDAAEAVLSKLRAAEVTT